MPARPAPADAWLPPAWPMPAPRPASRSTAPPCTIGCRPPHPDHPDRCWIRTGHFGDLEKGPLYLRTEGHRSIRAAPPWTPVGGPPAAGLAGALVSAGLPPDGALRAIAAALLPGAPLLVFGDTPPLPGLEADARQTQALRLADRGLLYPPPRLLRRISPSAGRGASG